MFAARAAQLHRRANGTSPGVITKQWSQLRLQEPFSLDPAHSIALALFTFHVISLRWAQAMSELTIIYQIIHKLPLG
jgi:hypothetical protein